MAEQETLNLKVVGSTPSGFTKIMGAYRTSLLNSTIVIGPENAGSSPAVPSNFNGPVTQRIESKFPKLVAVGSIPTGTTNFALSNSQWWFGHNEIRFSIVLMTLIGVLRENVLIGIR